MNKYLQQDTPTTETLLFKTSYIRMTESICTNIPKTYGFSSLQEERGREGGDKKKKKKAETPNFSKAKICSMKTKALKEKMSHVSGYGKPFWGWGGGSWGQEGAAPHQLGKVKPG